MHKDKYYTGKFEDIFSYKSLMNSWLEFRNGKKKKKDVADFVIFSRDKSHLESLIPKMKMFLADSLKLELHPDKVFIKTVSSGLDFLGWTHFEKHRTLRKSTKARMYQTIFPDTKLEVIYSYLGLLSYGNTYKIKQNVLYLLGDSFKLK